MPPKRKNRPPSSPPLFRWSKKSPDEKRSRDESDKIFKALDMAENLGVKFKAILKTQEKQDVIEFQLNEEHVKVASIEDSVSKLDSEIHVVNSRTTVKDREERGGTRRGDSNIMKMMSVTFNETTRNWSMRFMT